MEMNQTMALRAWSVVCVGMLLLATGCKPDEPRFKAENETLRKQLAKQESVVTSLQDGNRVMQQQIDLLNHELRDAKKAVDSTKAEARAALDSLEGQLNQAKRLTVEAQKPPPRRRRKTSTSRGRARRRTTSPALSPPLPKLSKRPSAETDTSSGSASKQTRRPCT